MTESARDIGNSLSSETYSSHGTAGGGKGARERLRSTWRRKNRFDVAQVETRARMLTLIIPGAVFDCRALQCASSAA